nr:hypothetical protein [Tanacetum cinerariifolium]
MGRYLGLGSLETKEAADCSTAALEVVEGAPDVDEGAQAVLTPVQSTQPPPAATPTRTITQRMTRLEEEVHGIRVALGEQIEDLAGKKLTTLVKYRSSGIHAYKINMENLPSKYQGSFSF